MFPFFIFIVSLRVLLTFNKCLVPSMFTVHQLIFIICYLFLLIFVSNSLFFDIQSDFSWSTGFTQIKWSWYFGLFSVLTASMMAKYFKMKFLDLLMYKYLFGIKNSDFLTPQIPNVNSYIFKYFVFFDHFIWYVKILQINWLRVQNSYSDISLDFT